jgi:hypothetical protein
MTRKRFRRHADMTHPWIALSENLKSIDMILLIFRPRIAPPNDLQLQDLKWLVLSETCQPPTTFCNPGYRLAPKRIFRFQ